MVFLYAFSGGDAIDCNKYYQNWSDGRWYAGYAEIGNDIICAAVSALTQGLVHSLKALTNDEISYRIAGGHVDIEYKDLSERGCLLVDSFLLP